ncbi:MAG: peptidase T [Bacteroidota bacterium]
MEKLLPRFLDYVSIDTQSDPASQTTPSTKKQLVLAKKLVFELHQIGMEKVSLDKNGYIMAHLPGNADKELPTIGFIAHYDTTPDFTGTNVTPQVVENYTGGDIILDNKENIVLSPSYFEDLNAYKGQTIITTNGHTLLGADDKAGVAEIITAMEYLTTHPEIKHGNISIAFTPDEEIGKGAHLFDVEKFGAEWAYTVDGGAIGELEFENFNAASAKVTIHGKSVHPGTAKGKMINAAHLTGTFLGLLPRTETPENTAGNEGFFHVHSIQSSVEHSEIDLIIRDHDLEQFEARKALLRDIVKNLNSMYEEDHLYIEVADQYRNMKEKILPLFHIVELAEEAMTTLGITPIIKPIRGGTDGSQLSFMGLPCPNIFAGGHNFHGRYEYIPLESMQKAVMVIVKICELTATKIFNYGERKKN